MNKLIILIAMIAATAMNAYAENPIPLLGMEPGVNKNSTYTTGLDGIENINVYSGTLNLTYKDIVLPGNGGLDIVIYRTYNSINAIPGFIGADYLLGPGYFGRSTANGVGWDIHMGRVLLNSIGCEAEHVINGTTALDNPVLELPDGRREVLYKATSNYHYPLITKNFWAAVCNSNISMDVYSPDGLKYTMNRENNVDAGTAALSVTRIEDRNGNFLTIDYIYQGAQDRYVISSITASDGRTVTFDYGNYGLLTSISKSSGNVLSGQKVQWEYTYVTSSGKYFLASAANTATGLSWQYDYKAPNSADVYGMHSMSRLTTPYGATVEYEYEAIHLGQVYNGIGLTEYSTAIKKRTLLNTTLGDGLTKTYNYYVNASNYNYTYISSSPGTTEHFTICGEVSLVVGGNRICNNIGAVLNKTVYRSGDLNQLNNVFNGTGLLESTDYVYTSLLISNQQDVLRSNASSWGGYSFVDVNAETMVHQSINRGDTYFNVIFAEQDKYLNPRGITEYDGRPLLTGYLQGPVTVIIPADRAYRQMDYTYYENTVKWIIHETLSEKLKEYKDSSGNDRQNDVSKVYDNGNVTSIKRFNAETVYTRFGTGDIQTEQDPLGKITSYSNYRCGIAEVENKPLNVAIYREVNADCTLASITNGRGYKTNYTYDDLGRVVLIEPPGASNPVTVNYSFGARNHTTQRGDYSQTLYLDGLGRVIREVKGGIETTYDYDANGRLVFRSHPGSTGGIQYVYDYLNRVLKETETADATETNYEYLDGNQVRVTDARNKVTIYTYKAMGSPDSKELMKVEPVNDDATVFTTSINRNYRGDVNQIQQGTQFGDLSQYQNRYFDYDENYFQDRLLYPETGLTLLDKNSLGNIVSSQVDASASTGWLTAASTTPSGVTTYSYDDLHRLTLVDYPNATPDTQYTYDNNNNVKTITHGQTVWSYVYDENDNLTSETLSYGGSDYALSYRYNGNDVLDRITYPDNLFVDLSPNNLGQPTRAGTFATNIAYYPNGQVSGLTYGNSRTLSITQNNRLFTDTIQGGGVSGVSLSYGYDAVGNTLSVTDHMDTTYNLSLNYDALNRLTEANGKWGLGSIQYDVHQDRITQYKLGSNTVNYTYEGALLNNISGTNSRSFTYDVYKNVKANGAFNFTYNDAGHLQTVRGIGAQTGQNSDYVYDGNGMRVSESDTLRVSVYGKSGQLMYEKYGNSWKDYIRVGSILVGQNGCGADIDLDLIVDCDELTIGLDPGNPGDAGLDPDNDDLTNLEEYQHGLAVIGYNGMNGIYINDFDQDGMPDGYEVDNGLNPKLVDDANLDFDGDTLINLFEFSIGIKAGSSDSDSDGVRDDYEITHGMNALSPDSDGDTIADGYEVTHGLNPLVNDTLNDLDSDGFSNLDEFNGDTLASDPTSYPAGKLRWSFTANDVITSVPAIDNDRIYFATNTGTIYAIRKSSAATNSVTVLWTFETGQRIDDDVMPVISADGTIYIVGRYIDGRTPANYLNAISRDGILKWSLSSTAPYQSNPAIGIDGTIYIGTDDSYLNAILPMGVHKWRYALSSYHSGFHSVSTPSIGREGHIYLTVSSITNSENVKALLTMKDGGSQGILVNQRVATGGLSSGQPIIANNDTVYFLEQTGAQHIISSINKDGTSRRKGTYSVRPRDFTLRGNTAYGEPVLAYEYDPGLRVVSGEYLGDYWNIFNADMQSKTAIGDNGFVYAIDDGGISEVEGLPTEYPAIIRWTFIPGAIPLKTTFPIIAGNGDIYYGGDNVLYAVSSMTKPEQSSWPMMGQNHRHTSNVCSLSSIDTDGDQIPDCYEIQLGLDLNNSADALADLDSDGINNRDEILHHSFINDDDSDDDGLKDGYEIANGLSAIDSDTDIDGMNDGYEFSNGLNPLLDDTVLDTDFDGYSNLQEYNAGTSASSMAEYPGMPGSIRWTKKIDRRANVNLTWLTLSLDSQANIYTVEHVYDERLLDTIYYFYSLGKNEDSPQSDLKIIGATSDVIHDNAGTAYIFGGGQITAINTTTSPPSLRWSTPYIIPVSSGVDSTNIALGNGYVYYVSGGYLRRISTSKTNAAAVALPVNLISVTPPVVAPNGSVYISGWDDTDGVSKVYCYSSSLALVTSFTTTNYIEVFDSPIVFTSTMMIIPTGIGAIELYNLSNVKQGEYLVDFVAPEQYLLASSVIGPNNKLYINYSDGIREFDLNTHAVTWFYPATILSSFAPAVASDGTVYVLEDQYPDAKLTVFNPDKTIKWQKIFATPAYSLRIGRDGTVYVLQAGSNDSGEEIIAINDNTNGYALSPWPMEGHDPQRSNNATMGATTATVTITAPTTTTYYAGASVSFTATVTNAGANVVHWYSSISGSLGTGLSLPAAPLIGGVHVIKAQLEDTNGVTQAMDNITLQMTTALPVLTVTSPTDNSIVINTTPVTLTASATHATQGNISSAIQWTSSIDGNIGTGGTVLASLSLGTHTITATVTDSAGHSTRTTRQITVTSASDTDADGMADAWEQGMFDTLSRNGSGDFNGDGISDLTAYNNYMALPRDGDVNANGEVNVADQLLLMRHVNGLTVLTDAQKARVDLYPATAPDGKLTIQDLLLLQRRVLGLY